jgi:hypothetical protein
LTVVDRLKIKTQQDRLVASASLVLKLQQERDDIAIGERREVAAAAVVGRLELLPHPITGDEPTIILNATPCVVSGGVVVGVLAGSNEVELVVGAGRGGAGPTGQASAPQSDNQPHKKKSGRGPYQPPPSAETIRHSRILPKDGHIQSPYASSLCTTRFAVRYYSRTRR